MFRNYTICVIIFLSILLFGCTQKPAETIKTYECSDGKIVGDISECISDTENENQEPEESVGCVHNNPSCGGNYDCIDNVCVLKEGCNYGNPSCDLGYECIYNTCKELTGCKYNNPICGENEDCINNLCIKKRGCDYNNPPCDGTGQFCEDNICKRCRDDSDCGSIAKCEEYNCVWYSKCAKDTDCGTDQRCMDQQCYRVVDCSSGYCEDKYFKLENVYITPVGQEYSETTEFIFAKITAKTDHKGSFSSGWMDTDSRYTHYSGGSTEYQDSYDHLDFKQTMMSNIPNIRFCFIMQDENPKIYYIVER
ncbi:MAG: hypothetical protein WC501_03790 [Candidatus Micrarchaeia archaeon]